MAITIVGLGPGNPALLTRQAWHFLSSVKEVYLRTSRHPVVRGLPAGLIVHSFDSLYEEDCGFEAVYEAITTRLLELGKRPNGVLYAVPGHPMVGEATVASLIARAPAEGVPVQLVDGVSFIEPVLTALKVDAMAGLQVADALDLAVSHHPKLSPDMPALLGQLFSRDLASDVKLTLMNQYPDEHQVFLVHGAGSEDQELEVLPLYAIDRSKKIAHLTCLFVPPLPQASSLASFQETVARLRGPGGCPWDQQQSHQSLTPGLVEELAEVVDALDADDMEALCEELGDLLLHIVMQAQIATEEGVFTMADVIAGIEAKIRRRHPHVFGDVQVTSVEQVFATWDAIKENEGKPKSMASALDGIPISLPALSRADAYSRKAGKAGFDWPSMEKLVARVQEKMEELLAATTVDEQVAEMGDLLFTIVNWARWLRIDSETALRMAIRRFRQRFMALESAARLKGVQVADLETDEIHRLWREDRFGAESEAERGS